MTAMTEIEERIAHLLRSVDDLSDVVADQANRIERLERQVLQLRERAAAEDASAEGQIPLADQRPPHW